ncbi:MAG: universal stress protein [Candidatus Omnitrophica bacterium]|nr:universal stress protein [Candidatus Omnitrophota bacterium]
MADEREFDISDEGQAPHHIVQIERQGLLRVLRVRDLFAIGYSDVGSSIYYALGVTALYALGATPLALALAGIAFFCTSLTYAEMASALPEAGGSASFARHAFNDMVSFVAGWALLLDYIVTIAISAFTVGPYLSYFIPALKGVANVPFSLMVLGVLLSLNILGIRESTRVSLLLCIFDIATQLTIIVIGTLFLLNIPHVIEFMKIGVPGVDWSPTWPQFWKGVSMAMVAYIGIESISQLGGETHRPGRALPRATLLTMVSLFVMYFGISTIALSAMHPKVLATQYLEDPLAGIAAALPIGGKLLAPWVGVLGATILFVAANAGLIGASRLTFALGEHYQVPRLFYRLHPRFRTPYISLSLFAGLAALVILVARRLTFIADLYNFGAMLAFSLAHLSLLGLRIRKPELERPFRIPFGIPFRGVKLPVPAIVGLLATVAVWIDVVITKPAGRNLGFLWMGVGLICYLAYRKRQKIPATAHVEIEHVKVPEFAHLEVRKILVPTLGGPFTENLQIACEMAKPRGAAVTALYVIEIPASMPLDTFLPDRLGDADGALKRAQAVGREFEVAVVAQLLQARSAGQAIVDVAKEKSFDLIVMGSSYRRGAAAWLGSTTEYVIRNAPCRVLICKTTSK